MPQNANLGCVCGEIQGAMHGTPFLCMLTLSGFGLMPGPGGQSKSPGIVA
jgi:hypothetical protein